jgi:hypothetical protein
VKRQSLAAEKPHQAPAPDGTAMASFGPKRNSAIEEIRKSFEIAIITVFIKSSNRRQNHMAKNKETSHRGTGKGQKLLSGTRDQLIKDLQRVHKVFPTAQPDRDFYRVHGKYTDAAVKVHFSRFKDFAAAAVPEMTPDEAFKLAVRSLDRAIDLIQKWHEDAKYGEGWVKHQIDAVNARVHELYELFYMWRLVKTIDDKEEQGEPIPTVLPDPEFLEEKQ